MTRETAITSLRVVLGELAVAGLLVERPRITEVPMLEEKILLRLENIHPPCGEESPDGCFCDRDD